MVQNIQRTAPVMVRFTPDEYEAVARQAKAEGRALANFIRSRLFVPEGGMIPATAVESAPHGNGSQSGETRTSEVAS